jgi:hypothetical protein
VLYYFQDYPQFLLRCVEHAGGFNFFFSRNVSPFFPFFHVTSIFVSIIRQFFGTWFFENGFLFSVKELGLLTNPGHWVRVLDATGSYMYIVL